MQLVKRFLVFLECYCVVDRCCYAAAKEVLGFFKKVTMWLLGCCYADAKEVLSVF